EESSSPEEQRSQRRRTCPGVIGSAKSERPRDPRSARGGAEGAAAARKSRSQIAVDGLKSTARVWIPATRATQARAPAPVPRDTLTAHALLPPFTRQQGLCTLPPRAIRSRCSGAGAAPRDRFHVGRRPYPTVVDRTAPVRR